MDPSSRGWRASEPNGLMELTMAQQHKREDSGKEEMAPSNPRCIVERHTILNQLPFINDTEP